jgi:hypothetical protein
MVSMKPAAASAEIPACSLAGTEVAVAAGLLRADR